jgi:hypothetical protein
LDKQEIEKTKVNSELNINELEAVAGADQRLEWNAGCLLAIWPIATYCFLRSSCSIDVVEPQAAYSQAVAIAFKWSSANRRLPETAKEAASVGGLFHVACWQILLQKSFRRDERDFPGPRTRFVRSDVRNHIASRKNDHAVSYRRYRALQRRSPLKIRFGEISGFFRFSTFSTASTRNGLAPIEVTKCVRAPLLPIRQ